MLKHLPEQYLPDPARCLPASDRLGKIEGTLVLASGTVALSLSAALFSGWLPTPKMASTVSDAGLEALTFSTMAFVSLWWGYVLWRSKGLGEQWESEDRRWLWGWGVVLQVLLGLAFLSVTGGLLLHRLLP